MSLLHPPSDRDLEVYESVCIARYSLRAAAEKHRLSITRIRQLVKRVTNWLTETLPPETDLDRQQQLQLARHLAADQIHYAQTELMDLWRQSQNTSLLIKSTRLSVALARLGVIPGVTGGLAADAWEAAGIEIDNNEDFEIDPEASPPPPPAFGLPTPPAAFGAGLPTPPPPTTVRSPNLQTNPDQPLAPSLPPSVSPSPNSSPPLEDCAQAMFEPPASHRPANPNSQYQNNLRSPSPTPHAVINPLNQHCAPSDNAVTPVTSP
jgi:hypothetical protein